MSKKVLIVNPFGIGDAIFSMVLVEALKKALPQVTVGFMGNERTVELLRMDRSIDRVHEFNRDELRALRKKSFLAYAAHAGRYLQEIRREKYDTLLDLSLGREFSFVALCLGIRRRVGFDYKRRGFFLTRRVPFFGYGNKPVAEHQLSLLNALGLEIPPVSARLPLLLSKQEEAEAAQKISSFGVPAEQRYFVVAPGGGKSWGANAVYKQWSPGRFVETIELWAGLSRQAVVLLGDQEEQTLLEEVKNKLKIPSVVVSGQGLPLVSVVLKRAQFLLCNDGGLLHLANALGVKTVSIFGPVDEKVYGPYGNDTPHEVLTQPVPCRPCYKDFHFPPCPHERRCLDELAVEKVLDAIKKIS